MLTTRYYDEEIANELQNEVIESATIPQKYLRNKYTFLRFIKVRDERWSLYTLIGLLTAL